MKLRDGLKNWPPLWTMANGKTLPRAVGEIGTLALVYSQPVLSTSCYLVIDHDGQIFVGSLIFENPEICQKISDFLQLHLKKPIKEIGNLEL